MGSILARIAMPLLAACTAACGGLITDSLVARYPLPLLLLERGETSASVEGYLAAGVPDPLFGSGGVAVIDGAARGGAPGGFDAVGDMTIDGEGRILLTGMSVDLGETCRMAVLRLLPGGSLDEGFGAGGVCMGAPSVERRSYGVAMAEDRLGRILIGGAVSTAGESTPVVWRLLGNGRLDEGFGTLGVAVIEGPEAREGTGPWRCVDVAVDGGGRIVGAGIFGAEERAVVALFRLKDDGAPDESFGIHGYARVEGPGRDDAAAIYGPGFSLAIDDRGRILAAGSIREFDHNDIAVWRFTAGGVPDNAFGHGGRSLIDLTTDRSEPRSNDMAFALALDGMGAAHVAGLRCRSGDLLEMALARLTPAGARDASFAGKGFLIIPGGMSEVPFSLALDRGERILVAGVSQNRSGSVNTLLWRYLRDGRPDIAFGCEGRILNHGASRGLAAFDSVIFGVKIAVTRAGGIIMAGAALNMGGDYDMAVWRYR